MAWTACYERNAHFAGYTRVGIGHMYGRRFVADMEKLDPGIERGIEHRHDVIAGQREDTAHVRGAKGSRQCICAPVLH